MLTAHFNPRSYQKTTHIGLIILLHFLLKGLAYKEHNQNVQFECKDELEYHRLKSDRSICPRRPDFNRLYSSYCKEKYGPKNGKEMFEHLDQKVSLYKESCPESNVSFQQYEEIEDTITPFILVIITPLMIRVHTMVSLVDLNHMYWLHSKKLKKFFSTLWLVFCQSSL